MSDPHCSFCKKSYSEIGPLVDARGEVFICFNCVEICRSVFSQELSKWIKHYGAIAGADSAGSIDKEKKKEKGHP